MDFVIVRKYGLKGTNGVLHIDSSKICETIELPNLDNQAGMSCIPEGKYEVRKRFSKKHGNHLIVVNVPNRSLILFHPANNAINELKGCIAPVSETTGFGVGIKSRIAFEKVRDLAYQAIDKEEEVYLIIKA